MKAKLFISYSHRDDRHRERLVTHLVGLREEGLISDWHDRKITPGEVWGNEIDQNLEAADCVLFLVSSDFLFSDYCRSVEMQRTLERHRERRVLAIPVIVRPADWQHSPLGKLQALPKDAKPVVQWSNRDSAWLDVVKGIRRALSRYELVGTPSDHQIPQAEPLGAQRRDFPTIPSEPLTRSRVPEARRAGSSLQILPFYLVCEESASMAGTPIDAINNSLPELHQEIGSNPVVADKTRFCLIGFSDNADVLLPLADLSTVTQMPKLTAGGGTNYKAAFETLRTAIESDVASLEQAGVTVYRPVVFFLSCSQPNNDWVASFKRLTDREWRPYPNILAFGFGDADANIINLIATFKGFMADGTTAPAEALREYAGTLINSVVTPLRMPDVVPGFTNISAPPIPDDRVPGFTNIPNDII